MELKTNKPIETFMADETIEKVRKEFLNWRWVKALKRVMEGIRRLFLLLWYLIGRVDSFLIISGFFVTTGIVNLILIFQDVPASGFDVLTHDNSSQIALAAGFIFLGWITGYSKSLVALTISCLIAIFYAFAVATGVYTGEIDMRGLLPMTNNLFIAFAVMRASWAEYQKMRYEKGLADLKAANAVNQRF